MNCSLFAGRSGNPLPGDDCHNPEILIVRGLSGEEKPEPEYFL
jgi:hypothetical protein